MPPQGATRICSLWVLFLPNLAEILFLSPEPMARKGEAPHGSDTPSWTPWIKFLLVTLNSSSSSSSMSSATFTSLSSSASFGWETHWRFNFSWIWTQDSPRRTYMCLTSWWKGSPQVHFPLRMWKSHPLIAQMLLKSWWQTWYRSLEVVRGVLQFWWAHVGWPRLIPSMTATQTDFAALEIKVGQMLSSQIFCSTYAHLWLPHKPTYISCTSVESPSYHIIWSYGSMLG